MASSSVEIEQILQICLDKLQKDHEKIDVILSRYPDASEELRPELEAADWLLKHKSFFSPLPECMCKVHRRMMLFYPEWACIRH